jgi:mRNA-degrading endonuclease YafQ of YafQ-DinJ toxin-antitoxin module
MSQSAFKSSKKLPDSVRKRLIGLLKLLEISGPVQKNYQNFSRLKGEKTETYHCHLKKGKPTYVVVWKVEGNRITVQYVGTHESAPY